MKKIILILSVLFSISEALAQLSVYRPMVYVKPGVGKVPYYGTQDFVSLETGLRFGRKSHVADLSYTTYRGVSVDRMRSAYKVQGSYLYYPRPNIEVSPYIGAGLGYQNPNHLVVEPKLGFEYKGLATYRPIVEASYSFPIARFGDKGPQGFSKPIRDTGWTLSFGVGRCF